MSNIRNLHLWKVWGDETEPVAVDFGYTEMVELVDRLRAEGRDEVYGEQDDTGEVYE